MNKAEPRSIAHPFRLVPFAEARAMAALPADLELGGQIERQGATLRLIYRLHGALPALRIPAPAARPQRCDDLWQGTCFELFLAAAGAEPYREFNLSPSGDWNVYRLDGYRRGLRPDPAWQSLHQRRDDGPGTLTLTLETPLPADLAAAPELEAAVTAVLQSQSGDCSYWAIRHPGA
ncbi:MAG: hypothetical protein ACKO25_11750, partial [Cyanobium sp.]